MLYHKNKSISAEKNKLVKNTSVNTWPAAAVAQMTMDLCDCHDPDVDCVQALGKVSYPAVIDDMLAGTALLMSAEFILYTPVTRPHAANTRHTPATYHT